MVEHGPTSGAPGVRDGRRCGRQVAKLYSGGRYYLCRHCLRVTYQSRSETRRDRLLRRQDALCVALGGEIGVVARAPQGDAQGDLRASHGDLRAAWRTSWTGSWHGG